MQSAKLDDDEHERNINMIKIINRNIELKTCAGGNINRMEDIKKFFYAGCLQVIVNGSKPDSIELAEEAATKAKAEKYIKNENTKRNAIKQHEMQK